MGLLSLLYSMKTIRSLFSQSPFHGFPQNSLFEFFLEYLLFNIHFPSSRISNVHDDFGGNNSFVLRAEEISFLRPFVRINFHYTNFQKYYKVVKKNVRCFQEFYTIPLWPLLYKFINNTRARKTELFKILAQRFYTGGYGDL